MPMVSATRRASYTSSSEQQRPCTASGIPARPARRRWFHNCMVRPITFRPSARSMAATVEESTPPDMATAMVSWFGIQHSGSLRMDRGAFIVQRRELSQSGDRRGYKLNREVHLFSGVLLSDAESNAGAGAVRAQPHGGEDVRRLNRSGGTCCAG